MRFDVITLFPDLFAPFLAQGITRRAYESGQVDVKLWNLRDHAEGTYRRVDDRPFGGGPGMVMLAEPLERALGDVLGLIDTGPHCVLRVKPASAGEVPAEPSADERLIPFVEAYVDAVDIAGRRIVVDWGLDY